MSSAHYTTLTTPDGPFTVILAEGVVLASGWTKDLPALQALIHPQLRPQELHQGHDDTQGLGLITHAVEAYYSGDVTALHDIPVQQHSGPFREHAWQVLREVPPGEPITYTRYAQLAGRPTAVRAAASACAMNAAALFVPCHRVVRTDGSLGGFRYGLEVKRSLLVRESL